MRKGESAQHDRVNDGELGCGTANAKSEHEHCQKTKHLVLEQKAQSDAKILTKRIQNHDDFSGCWLTIHPSRNWMTRCPYEAFFSECVTCTMVMPSSLSFRNNSMISSP